MSDVLRNNPKATNTCFKLEVCVRPTPRIRCSASIYGWRLLEGITGWPVDNKVVEVIESH